MSRDRAPWRNDIIFLTILLLLASVLVTSLSVGERLDHDENQFVASAALLARRGLLPYRDYPYFHTPYLVFADALLFKLQGSSGRLLLGARLLSAACGVATAGLLGAATLAVFRSNSIMTRRVMAGGAVFLLIANPTFAGTSGRAWNHDASEVLLFAAAIAFLRCIRRVDADAYPFPAMLLIGGLLGASIGVRLTVAPACAAFVGWILSDPRLAMKRRLAPATILLIGIGVALLPCAWLFAQAPRGFVFGNFQYPTLNTAWRISRESVLPSTTPIGKITYFLNRILFSSGNGILLTLVVLTLLRPAVDNAPATNGPGSASRLSSPRQSRFLGILILFLLVGSFAPAPLFMVYFYAPAPFVLLWLAYIWQRRLGDRGGRPMLQGLRERAAAALALACLACAVQSYRHLWIIFSPEKWPPIQIHETGLALRRMLAPSSQSGAGPVLTLAPIYPLEGSLDIYEQFATGPFAMRIAGWMSTDDEAPLHLINEHDFPLLFRHRPPAAVLIGVEGDKLELPLVSRANEWGCPVIRAGGHDGEAQRLEVQQVGRWHSPIIRLPAAGKRSAAKRGVLNKDEG